jgi:putative spermidine/putrescine transport system ATP-binding protein
VKVSKHFGATTALDDVELELPSGKLVCFLGPSGCGKTTLIRIVAGLETPSRGRVLLGERDLTDVPPHHRNIGMVFQSFALFPHLTVAENVGYGLRIRGMTRSNRRKRAEELLALVRLEGTGHRHVSQLSGGQRQRVAMARALALEPSLFLLDEPLSALDAKLRGAMQVELRELQERLGITTVIVTHDQEEAMTMADLVVVMGEGRVQQVGSPLEVYHQPWNRFVADFIGANNFLDGVIVGARQVRVLGQTVAADVPAGLPAGTEVTLSIRPEKLRLAADGEEGAGGGASAGFDGRVAFVRDLGKLVETFVDVHDQRLLVLGAPPLEVGRRVRVTLPTPDCVVLPR